MGRKRNLLLGSLSIGIALSGLSCIEPAQDVSNVASESSFKKGRPEKKNIRWVGHNDLQARSAYQPTIQKQGNRYIAYVGHHTGLVLNPLNGVTEFSGTSIVDVTDPRRPQYLAHIPGVDAVAGGFSESGGAQMTRVCSGDVLPQGTPGKVYLLRSLGSISHQIWDVTNPASPSLLSTVMSGLTNTHKNFWECETGIAYLVAGAGAGSPNPDGWKVNQHMVVYNLANPAAPQYIRDFGLAGTNPTSSLPVPAGASLHGPISVPSKNRIYLAMGVNRSGNIQILDRSKVLPPPWGNAVISDPVRPTDAELQAAQLGLLQMPSDAGAHTTFPLFDIPVPAFANHTNPRAGLRNLIVMVSESFNARCQDFPQLASIIDATEEKRMWPLSTMMVDERTGNPPFCSRGARFAAHSSNESFYAPWYGKLIATSWFNAGTRIWDIRDPYHPQEVAYFIPPANDKTSLSCAPGSNPPSDCKANVMTNNVELDDRGLIYAVDRANSGMDILSLSGSAANIVSPNSYGSYHDLNGEDD